MRGRRLASLAIISLLGSPATAQTFTPGDEKPEDYPPGRGREETFYACTPCHGFRIVAQQGQTRRQWDDTLDWMTERYSMPPLQESDRTAVLDYLEAAFPPRARQRWQNPFQR
jgi:hypothetical protein